MRVGADVAALRGLGATFGTAATTLDATRSRLDALMRSTWWQGPTGSRFVGAWETTLRNHLVCAEEALRDAAGDVARQADEQERTSATGGSPGPTASPPSFLPGAAGAPPIIATAPAGAAPVMVLATAHAGPATPLTPEQILARYQVSDGKVLENWEPDWPASLFTEPRPAITEKEAEMLNGLNPLAQKSFQDIHDRAFDFADERFEPGDQNDNHNDAFRHAYWNALMTRKYGEAWAEDYATAHEQLPGNPPAREAMDLYNNEVGRRIAAENPDVDIYQLADLVEKAVKDGETVVVGPDGNLVHSDQVSVGKTGTAAPAEPLPGQDPPFNDESSES